MMPDNDVINNPFAMLSCHRHTTKCDNLNNASIMSKFDLWLLNIANSPNCRLDASICAPDAKYLCNWVEMKAKVGDQILVDGMHFAWKQGNGKK